MEIKCEFCGAYINDTDATCPNCGAVNEHHKRTADHTPQTIEELKQWYEDRHLPPYDVTRFYIGVNYQSPKAFGIYEDNGKFIVYKNKADGSRAIRYQGTDEAYAVNELYLKLKSEILNQKSHQNSGYSERSNSKNKSGIGKGVLAIMCFYLFGGIISYIGPIGLVLFIALASLPLIIYAFIDKHANKRKSDNHGKKFGKFYIVYLVALMAILVSVAAYKHTPRYYKYDNSVYCLYDGDYYEYDDYSNDYSPINKDYLPVEIVNNGPDYEYDTKGLTWDSDYTFEDSDYYEENLKSSDSWDSSDSDSSYDWDSGSDWDSGGSDWDSDW